MMADLLFSKFLSQCPLFKGLSPVVIAALCMRCKPMLVVQGSVIIAEGEPGKEMYIVMSGEVEVSEKRLTGNPDDPISVERLGFLAEGAFFGESPLLGKTETSMEIRMRTVPVTQNTHAAPSH
eukprot:SAG31_NODE_22861_length_516_cov_1.151079_1_plen_123_part_01